MDRDLVIAAQRGDEEAFATLVVGHGGRLQAVAHRILRDYDLAEDATQQALLRIWKSLPKLRDPARFETWSQAGSAGLGVTRADEELVHEWVLVITFEPFFPHGMIGCTFCG